MDETDAPAAIRPFAPSDAEAVVRLWGESGLLVPWNDPRRDIVRKLAQQPELFLVAEAGGAVAGTCMAGFDGHRGWIYYLAVDPVQRSQGIGAALVGRAEELLRLRGCPKVQLMVRPGNAHAVEFYEELGYGPQDVLVLGKRLITD
jgi:ribosomal protein S18 acetylase RimI-like enzyme